LALVTFGTGRASFLSPPRRFPSNSGGFARGFAEAVDQVAHSAAALDEFFQEPLDIGERPAIPLRRDNFGDLPQSLRLKVLDSREPRLE
jgi:hypothetical protein